LFAWFSEVIRKAVPPDGSLFAYHIPGVSGVGFSLDLLSRLKKAFPRQFVGIKDSSGSAEFASELGGRFKDELVILNGTDRLLSHALAAGASGCITAMANLVSPDLRRVWEAHTEGNQDEDAQNRLNQARAVFENYPPAPPLLKGLLNRFYHFPLWSVRPPLLPIPEQLLNQAASELPVLENVL
jgi:dihydrodipicolinate synthase/N-acetylneuraminate lyase